MKGHLSCDYDVFKNINMGIQQKIDKIANVTDPTIVQATRYQIDCEKAR